MKKVLVLLIAMSVGAVVAFTARDADCENSQIFGGKLTAGYRDWKLISVAHEAGKLNDLRAILGTTQPLRRIGRGSCHFQMARSSLESPGIMSPRRRTTKSSAITNPSWPVRRRTCSLWSRTANNTLRRAAGGLRNLTTANPPILSPTIVICATCPLRTATSCSLVTRLDSHRGSGDRVLQRSRLLG